MPQKRRTGIPEWKRPAPAGSRGKGTANTVTPEKNEMTASTCSHHEIGQHLAEDHFHRPQRRGENLLMVPISHSRAMVSVVNSPVRIMRMMAMSPGHHEVLGLQRAVVPDAHLRRHGGRQWLGASRRFRISERTASTNSPAPRFNESASNGKECPLHHESSGRVERGDPQSIWMVHVRTRG